MKSYKEIADSVFARRDQYVIAQRKKKQAITRVTASVGSVALVAVASVGVWRSKWFAHNPPLSDHVRYTTSDTTDSFATGDVAVTTAPTAPTTNNDVLPSAATTAGSVLSTTPAETRPTVTQTNPTVTPTEPTVTQTKPTVTQSRPILTQSTPTKTEPSKTTATQTKPTTSTVPGKVLVVADKVDNTGKFEETEMSVKKKYISRRLNEVMAYYEGEDYYKGGDTVVYAVIVSMPMMKEYTETFWNSNEEWVQILKEQDETYNAWYTEAKQVNPSWDGISDDIEWTDTMRSNYERWLALIDERNSIQSEYYRPYIQVCIDQQFEALKAVSGMEPVDILEDGFYTHNAYYVELTADAINTLAERGGYTFSLAMANQRDYSGYWVGVE